MASYEELFDLRSNTTLRNKIAVACVKKAQELIDGETPSGDQIAFANQAISQPLQVAERIMNYVLAANSGASVATITSAADSLIQTHVSAAIDALIAGGVTS